MFEAEGLKEPPTEVISVKESTFSPAYNIKERNLNFYQNLTDLNGRVGALSMENKAQKAIILKTRRMTA